MKSGLPCVRMFRGAFSAAPMKMKNKEIAYAYESIDTL